MTTSHHVKDQKTKAAMGVAASGEQYTKDSIVSDTNPNSANSQCARLLDYLRQNGSATSIQIRNRLDILHPGARVLQLRNDGHNILTIWTHDETSEGKKHRVARYVLIHKGCAEKNGHASTDTA